MPALTNDTNLDIGMPARPAPLPPPIGQQRVAQAGPPPLPPPAPPNQRASAPALAGRSPVRPTMQPRTPGGLQGVLAGQEANIVALLVTALGQLDDITDSVLSNEDEFRSQVAGPT